MTQAQSNEIELEFDTFGDSQRPAIMLIMGLGQQMIAWPEPLCNGLASEGFYVVRFDNRDSGLSTKFESFGVPNILAGLSGDGSGTPYSLVDMADDTVGLMDYLDIKTAHVVGVSMGGMIAQQAVIDSPDRFLSMCSMISSTGARDVGQPSAEVVAALMRLGGADNGNAVESSLEASKVISSRKYFDQMTERKLITTSYERNYCPGGFMRQLMATVTATDRTAQLREVSIPTLVIHGLADKLVDPSGGIATARAIPDARLLAFEGMAHELPVPLWPEIRGAILANIRRAAVSG